MAFLVTKYKIFHISLLTKAMAPLSDVRNTELEEDQAKEFLTNESFKSTMYSEGRNTT